MPYRTNEDLPAAVKDHLPPHAQDIFRAALNAAFNAHAGEGDREAVAFRIAWTAVRRGYRKEEDGRWTARSGQPR